MEKRQERVALAYQSRRPRHSTDAALAAATKINLRRFICFCRRDGISSHALVSAADKARVRVIPAMKEWPNREVKKVLKKGRPRHRDLVLRKLVS